MSVIFFDNQKLKLERNVPHTLCHCINSGQHDIDTKQYGSQQWKNNCYLNHLNEILT